MDSWVVSDVPNEEMEREGKRKRDITPKEDSLVTRGSEFEC